MRFTADAADALLMRLSDTPLAIHPTYWRRMRAVLDGTESREALTAQLQKRAPRFQSTKGIAVIPVVGPIFHRADAMMEFFFGATSVEQIGANVKAAQEDPDIDGILFDVDSPGGEVSGVADLSDLIFEARASGKPMLAVANEDMYSAAYWIASSANQVVLPRTAGVGSIGVRAMHVDQSKMLANLGVDITEIVSGEKKNQFSPFQPLSEEARADLQAEVDRLARLFEGVVARNRGLSPKAVRAFQAGTLHGPDAVEAKLADAVLVADDALNALQITISEQRRPKKAAAVAVEEDVMEKEETQPAVVAAAPAEPVPTTNVVSINKAREEGHREGASAAKAEAQAIAVACQLNRRPELAAGFIAEGKSSKEVISALLAMDAEKDEQTGIRTQHAETGAQGTGENPGLLALTSKLAAASSGGRK
jgi:signal peptide peptidase SppA